MLFKYTPYRHRLYAQFFQTTNGFQFHELNYDAPYFLNTKFRLRSALSFEKNIAANYFGVGERTMQSLSANGKQDLKYIDYLDEIEKIDTSTNTTNKKFNQFEFERPSWFVKLKLIKFLVCCISRSVYLFNFIKVIDVFQILFAVG